MVGLSVTHTHSDAFELSQPMDQGNTAGALIHEIVRRGFQQLLEAEVSALTGAQPTSVAPISAPPTAMATAGGCSPSRCATPPWLSPN